MNMLEARIEQRDGALAAVFGDTVVELDEETLSRRPALAAYAGREIVLGIRPEDLDDAALADGDAGPRIRGRVDMREALGSEVLVHFTGAARQAVTDEMRELAEDVGDDRVLDQLASGAQPEAAALVGRFSPQTRVIEGAVAEVSVRRPALRESRPSKPSCPCRKRPAPGQGRGRCRKRQPTDDDPAQRYRWFPDRGRTRRR